MAKNLGRSVLVLLLMITFFNVGALRVDAAHHTFTNYYGIEMTETEYFNLLNLGFLEHEIYYMDEDTYNDNKDIEAVLVDKNTKYYKTVVPYYGASQTSEVTLSEYLNHNNGDELLDTSTTLWNEITSTISYKNDTKYRYKTSVDWLDIPPVHSYDVIGIGFQDDVYISSVIFFRFLWYNPDATTSQSTVINGRVTTPYGVTSVYKLPDSFMGLNATMFYDVSKDTNDTITSLSMCGDYAHSLSTVTATQASDHYMSYAGIGFDASVAGYFNEIPCTYGNIGNISW